MHPVNRAILLVAGSGRRLGSLTGGRPKCLVEVAGRPILERALDALSASGVRHAVLVIGHGGDLVKELLGESHAGVRITYVMNPVHDQTGTAYSLWLARDYLDTDCYVIEGDIVFDLAAIRRILSYWRLASIWAAVPVRRGLDEGILLRGQPGRALHEVRLVREPADRPEKFTYKCAGIQLLSQDLAREFARRLDSAVAGGGTRAFADEVLGQLLPEWPVTLCSLAGERWAEVDTPDDLAYAHQVFARRPSLSQQASRADLNGRARIPLTFPDQV